MSDPDPRVHYEVADHVARLTVDVPDRLNAFDGEMAAVILRHLESAAADSDVRVLVFTGANGAFSAGGDLKSMLGSRRSDDAPSGTSAASLDSRTLLGISELLHSMPAVTIAAIDGVCAGGAMGWACSCDLRIASRSARFVPAFAAAGQTGDYGITWALPRIVGEGRAREMLLLGDHLDAAQALEIGLVGQVHDREVFESEVSEIARLLASRAPLALQGIKKNLDVAGRSSLAEALDSEASTMAANMVTADAREAMAAFAEKREPRFQGR